MNGDCSLEFVGIGCNIVSGCAAWGRNDIVAYGAANFVGLYVPSKHKVMATLPGHSGRVNTVKWIAKNRTDKGFCVEDELISGSSDSTLITWKVDKLGAWNQTSVLKGHKDSVTSVDCITYPDGSLLAASTSSDCTLNIWKRPAPTAEEDASKLEWKLCQTISFAPKMMDCVSLVFLPSESPLPILACAGMDTVIHLYIEANGAFHKLSSLQGHQDWIRSLAFAVDDNSDVLLASSSQDTKVRLWKITPETASASSSLVSTLDNSTKATALSSKGAIFKVGSTRYTVLLESVLAAHEEWVYSVCWQPPVITAEGKLHQPMALLSASMDKNMMIWRPSKTSTIWINEVRVGGLGGNTLGFYGGVFSPDGNSILAHGYNGAFHLWTQTAEQVWKPQVTVSGHFGPVADISWDPTYQYLVSVSEDQTTRLFSKWVQDSSKPITWHEISRPQIHGYDMTCISFVNNVPNRVISGAEEKVLRVFDCPQTTVASLQNVSKISLPEATNQVPLGANVPPLGLSNKPVFTESDMAQDSHFEEYEAPAPMPIVHEIPPYEDHLLQSTLWPEVHKLYGHPNEIVAVTCNYSGTLIASSCKGTKPEQSAIRIWNANTFKELTVLTVHTLTVVQLEFSHDDKHLLSVSRDRQFCIFDLDDTKESFQLAFKSKAHERIIWSGAWSLDDKMIATGSRDKTVKIWARTGAPWDCVSTLANFEKGVTAVAWGLQGKNHYTLAVGLENGKISVWSSNPTCTEWNTVLVIDPSISHVDTIRRLRWQINPKQHSSMDDQESTTALASCSTDHSIRLFTIKFTNK